MENYILGKYINCEETLSIEFKEWCFKLSPSLYLSNDEIIECLNGKWCDNLDKLSLDNLELYIKYYLPKYISCFVNSNIDGNLYFGINDDGEISGIPLRDEIDKSYIKKLLGGIKYYLSDNIDLSEIIDIKIIKIEKKDEYLDDEIEELILEYKEHLNKYNKEMSDYIINKKKWIERIEGHSTKMYEYANNKYFRNLLLKYLMRNNKSNKLEMLIKLVKSDKEIDIPMIEEFIERKHNKEDIIYWLTEFKDDLIDNIIKERPIKPIPKLYLNEDILLIKISRLRKRLLNNVDYYLIEFNIKGSKIKNDIYFKSLNGRWKKRVRISTEYGPRCI